MFLFLEKPPCSFIFFKIIIKDLFLTLYFNKISTYHAMIIYFLSKENIHEGSLLN